MIRVLYLPFIFSINLFAIENKEKNFFCTNFNCVSSFLHIDYIVVLDILIVLALFIFLLIYWNIKMHKRIKQILQKNKKQERLLYQYSNKDEMENFLGNISHQWRQPIDELSSEILYLETKLLIKQDISNKELKACMEKSREIISFLSNTIDIFSNFFVKKQKDDLVSIHALLKKMIFISESTLKNANIKIKLSLKGDDLKIKGDELQQVILAIFNNIKNIVIKRKISSANIEIKLYEDKSFIVLLIKDDCGGIKDDINKIFDFGQSGSENGSGLGLYISKRIIEEKYEGKIKAKNITKGTLFEIKIPK